MRVGKIIVGVFAAIGLSAVGLALSLWLAARPVLEAARASYDELPVVAQCTGPHASPPGYPVSARQVETTEDAEGAVYRAICEAEGLTDSCHYMSGAPRWAGFKLYRQAYLSECELRAASLHGNTPLRRSLELLYPDRPVAELGEQEMTCVAHAMRGSSGLCGRHPECCTGTPQE